MTDEIDTELDADFAQPTVGEVALSMLVRGTRRREVAAELGLTLAQLHGHVAQECRRAIGEAGSHTERLLLIDRVLDEITAKVFVTLDLETEPVAPLLAALIDVQRIRAALLPKPTTREAKS
jgi:hypothetical protein